jgi:hypothetical protein
MALAAEFVGKEPAMATIKRPGSATTGFSQQGTDFTLAAGLESIDWLNCFARIAAR